jgi:hypothetical protein
MIGGPVAFAGSSPTSFFSMADCPSVGLVITLLPAGHWGRRCTEAGGGPNRLASEDAAHPLANARQYAVFSCQGGGASSPDRARRRRRLS